MENPSVDKFLEDLSSLQNKKKRAQKALSEEESNL